MPFWFKFWLKFKLKFRLKFKPMATTCGPFYGGAILAKSGFGLDVWLFSRTHRRQATVATTAVWSSVEYLLVFAGEYVVNSYWSTITTLVPWLQQQNKSLTRGYAKIVMGIISRINVTVTYAIASDRRVGTHLRNENRLNRNKQIWCDRKCICGFCFSFQCKIWSPTRRSPPRAS